MIRKFYFTLVIIAVASWSPAKAQQTEKVTPSGIGYLEYLPKGYNSNSNKYPLVISLHGIKEKGTASTDPQRVKADLQKVDNVGLPKYVKYGKEYPFILISPQLKSNYGLWPSSYIIAVLNHVRKYLRVDDRRIYLTGLSLGGFGVWRTAGDYPNVFAAIAPICAGGNALNKAKDIAAANVAVWGFHGSSDKVVSYQVTTKMVNAINSAPKKPHPLAKATIFPGMGHGVWDKAYNETNLLNWLLSVRKGSAPSLPPSDGGSANEPKPDKPKTQPAKKPASKPKKNNSLPIVNAGPDLVLTLPNNSATVRGQATDKDGKLVSYLWQQTYGGRASISGATSLSARISNLDKGVYIFRLRAKDNDGGIKDDYFKITVQPRASGTQKPKAPTAQKPRNQNSHKSNIPPVVNAGPDRVLTLPSNSIHIQCQASDKDGSIASYEWTKVSGGIAYVGDAHGKRVHIFHLHQGVYVFRLTVKDNDGAVRQDYFKITVNDPGKKVSSTQQKQNSSQTAGTAHNAQPVANAGADRRVSVSQGSVTLKGSGYDRDGRIVSYQWKQLSGPPLTIKGAGTPQATISGMKKGHYYFSFTVKDDDKVTDSDKMVLRVTGG